MNDNEGMSTCVKCGADIFPGASDCPRCGHVRGEPIEAIAAIHTPPSNRDRRRRALETPEAGSTQAKSAAPLVVAAIVLWLVSLALPGFIVESRTESWHGWQILLLGLPFGWMVFGFAVYANLFFVPIAIQLLQGKSTRVSVVFMVILAATLPFFRGVVQDEGSGAVLPVVSWGWGAVLWIAAIVLLAAAAAVRAGFISRASVRPVTVVLAGSFVGLVVLHIYQWASANEQERELYIPLGVAFTKAEFCGVSFNWPAGPLLASDSLVELDIDPELRSSGAYIILPTLQRYREGAFDWTRYGSSPGGGADVSVRSPAHGEVPTLQVKKTAEGAVIRLLEKDSAKVLYEQRLRARPRKDGYVIFCPYSRSAWQGLARGYDTAVARALGQEGKWAREAPRPSLLPESALETCDIGSVDIDGIKGLRAWDGREIILGNELHRTYRGFCSENYIALANLISVPASVEDLRAEVVVYDRKTLAPLAMFYGPSCPIDMHHLCKTGPRETITGVRIADDVAVVVTTSGELFGKRA